MNKANIHLLMTFRHLLALVLAALLLAGCQHIAHFQETVSPTASSQSSESPQPDSLNEPSEEVLENTTMDFSRAQSQAFSHSDKLLAVQADLRAKRLQAEALDNLRQPTVFINGSVRRYNIETDISTEALRNRLRHYGDNLTAQLAAFNGHLPPDLVDALGNLPSVESIPSSVALRRQDTSHSLSLATLMPVYTGGRIAAIQQLAKGRADAQASEVAQTEEDLQTQLVQRYFLVQLTQQVVKVRKEALSAVKTHDHAAQRMLDVGLIAKAERLQGAAALADARFQLEKAKDDLRLSQRALDSLLQVRDVAPTTPLFVNHQALNDLTDFQAQAQKNHPAFAKIRAKDAQAQASKSLRDAAWKPTVSAFGAHGLTGGADDWVIGLSARYTLNSPIDREKLQRAADATLAQIRAIKHQAQSDINLLVEKSWLAVSDALTHFDSLAKEETLAKEVLRLRNVGFREGLNTVIEVNDAQANLTKTRTERVKAAYDYVIALATLLNITGAFEQFADYASSADIKIK